MKKAIQFGAGNIGRGFIGGLLSKAGYHVVFADVNQEIIDKIDLPHGYWEFVTGLYDSIPDFVSIVELSCLVFLDDTQRFCLYLLISCKTFSAFVTLSSSTDRIVVFCRSGIYDSGILTSTIWASHLLVPPCFYCLKYIIFSVEKKAFLSFQAFFFVDID